MNHSKDRQSVFLLSENCTVSDRNPFCHSECPLHGWQHQPHSLDTRHCQNGKHACQAGR